MMATTLDVVNECLATLGEAPLNTLAEPHSMKGAATRALDHANRRIQATGWWFNVESLTLYPAPVTGHLQLPGDVLKFNAGVREPDTLTRGSPTPWAVQRGNRLYDTRRQTYVFDSQVTGEFVRLIPFEELPQVAGDCISASAVLKFQSDFDADNSRRSELQQAFLLCMAELRAEQTRQAGVNMLNNNMRLQRIKSRVRGLRY